MNDESWHSIMMALGSEFIEVGRASKDPKVSEAWVAAGKEVQATANQALTLANLPEKLVNGGTE